MNERIKELRKAMGLNQTAFGERLGIKQTTVAGYENGTRQPMEAVITSICREFNVHRKWLEHGEGEMFLPAIDEEMNYVSELLEDVDNPLYEIIKSIMKTYLELDEKQKEMVKSFAKNLKENIKESRD